MYIRMYMYVHVYTHVHVHTSCTCKTKMMGEKCGNKEKAQKQEGIQDDRKLILETYMCYYIDFPVIQAII